MKISKYSIGTGDRFAHECKAQLEAVIKACEQGADISPVWNKSDREHQIIGTSPPDTKTAADQAVKDLNWEKPYFIDADHININNVDGFIESSNFFTLDVADYIAKTPEGDALEKFIENNKKFEGSLSIPDIEEELKIDKDMIRKIGEKFLFAVMEAGKIYRHIESKKGKDNFVTEVSMDESDQAQTPVEMLFILSMIAQEKIPVQTIAPKFTGRFNKGVDYEGSVEKFTQEFDQDLAVINFAVKEFGLPDNLKLSVHSGSDKFSIYGPISKTLKKYNAGVHLKTAGTTWLEELIGLAEAEGEGLKIAKEIYKQSLPRFDELCGPYATVIDIDKEKLPSPEEIDGWDGIKYGNALRHDQSCEEYNMHFRQLLHVSYKLAAEMGARFTDGLISCREQIAKNVTENLFERHIKPLFID